MFSIRSPLALVLFIWASLSFSANAALTNMKQLTPYLSKDKHGIYHISSDEDLDYDRFVIEDGVLTLSGPKKTTSFAIETDLTSAQLEGVWFEYLKTNSDEISTKITRRANDYDYDTVELDHTNRSYYVSTQDDMQIPYAIIDGAILDEDTDYYYFVLSVSSKAVQFVDIYGGTFMEKKYAGEPLLEIPSGYTEQ
ncbi:hypothetical protein DBZ36_07795 [Alginatibacterium sediminis]|uniref:Uncharacterized protein n=1 Tax=Alginatibacterium sediminis TaxID=2164068 RepID=A0A420EI17_9ALTE|nr:hypothetical protein [Alginatibacterium sediminis]RKF20333.1 hypothetical protein DBZ36_07795 [Alginatibacterium sediminis]